MAANAFHGLWGRVMVVLRTMRVSGYVWPPLPWPRSTPRKGGGGVIGALRATA